MTELDLPPPFIFAFVGYSKPLLLPSAKACVFGVLGFTLCMQTGMLLPHAANGHANAKSGEKKLNFGDCRMRRTATLSIPEGIDM